MAQASSRRRFLNRLAWSAPALPLLRLPRLAAETASWQAVLVGSGEPGQPLVVSGRVLDESGSPRPGIRIDVYHTDAAGYYSRPVSDSRRARIRGSLTTDSQGRYEIRTIKPGSYHDRPQAAHIHVHLAGDGYPEHWVESFLFAGDPYLPASDVVRSQQAGRFAHVMEPHPRSGVLHATRDFHLDAQVAQRNRLVDGWYR